MICMELGVREEIIEPDEGNQGAEARPQHFRRWERRSSHQSCQGAVQLLRFLHFNPFFPYLVLHGYWFPSFRFGILISQVLEQLSGQTPVFSKGKSKLTSFIWVKWDLDYERGMELWFVCVVIYCSVDIGEYGYRGQLYMYGSVECCFQKRQRNVSSS